MRTLIDIELDAALKSVRLFRANVARACKGLGLKKEAVDNLSLVLSEISTNFIEHSNSIEKLCVNLVYSQSALTLNIVQKSSEDETNNLQRWLDTVIAAKKNPPSILDSFDIERSGGRGAGIVAQLSEEIHLLDNEYSDTHDSHSHGFSLSWCMEGLKEKKRILIVDDDRALSLLYASYLKPSYDAINVDDVDAALLALDHTHFDLILSDIHMPKYNGIEFRQKVANHNKALNIPFVFMSGDAQANENFALSQLGIDDFLTKPVAKSQLLNCVARVLTRASQLNQLNDTLRTQSITDSLLPKVPEHIPSWNITVKSDGPGYGGGDLLIVKKMGDSTLIVIADLMGHDHAAKFFSHAYLGYMRGVLCASSPEPEHFLQLLSNTLYEDELLSRSICTCCAIKLNSNGQIRVASAGHPPPLIISNNEISAINTGGMLPGLVADLVYTSIERQLKQGERLAIFTDGFIDPSDTAGSSQEANCFKHVVETLTLSLKQPLATSLEASFQTMRTYKGSPQTDDALLVLIEPD